MNESSLRDLASNWPEDGALSQVLLDALPMPVFVKDRAGLYRACNPAFEKFLGRSRDEIVGRTVFELSPPDLAGIYHARDLELFGSPGVQTYELQVQPARGERRTVVFHKATFIGTDGTVAGIIGVILDITEARRAEVETKASEARLGAILEATLTGILVVDAETRQIVSANPQALELIGLPAEAVLGRRCHRFVCAADEAQCPVLDHGKTVERSERVLLAGDGGRIPVLKTVRSFEEGGRSYLVESFLDIRELKEAHAALAMNNESLRAVIETSPLAIIAVDEHRRVTIWNRASEQLFGWTATEVTGQPLPIVPPECAEESQVLAQDAHAGRPVTGFETIRWRKDGTRIDVSLSTASLAMDNGLSLGALAIFEEIGARRSLQVEREALIQELSEALARVRTLSGILPICMHCKKIRDDQGYWSQVEQYVREHSDAVFSHGLCPQCYQERYGHIL